MTYRLVLQRLAVQDLNQAFAWAARNAPATAARWLDRFQTALKTLEATPQRCPLAKENSKAGIELREFLFGKKPNVFRVLFTIDETCETLTVRVLRIRRAQRRFLSRKQINEATQADE